MSFETSLKKLENISDKIRDDKTSLDEAIKCYEEGMKEYEYLKSILNNAEQKIEIYDKEATENENL